MPLYKNKCRCFYQPYNNSRQQVSHIISLQNLLQRYDNQNTNLNWQVKTLLRKNKILEQQKYIDQDLIAKMSKSIALETGKTALNKQYIGFGKPSHQPFSKSNAQVKTKNNNSIHYPGQTVQQPQSIGKYNLHKNQQKIQSRQGILKQPNKRVTFEENQTKKTDQIEKSFAKTQSKVEVNFPMQQSLVERNSSFSRGRRSGIQVLSRSASKSKEKQEISQKNMMGSRNSIQSIQSQKSKRSGIEIMCKEDAKQSIIQNLPRKNQQENPLQNYPLMKNTSSVSQLVSDSKLLDNSKYSQRTKPKKINQQIICQNKKNDIRLYTQRRFPDFKPTMRPLNVPIVPKKVYQTKNTLKINTQNSNYLKSEGKHEVSSFDQHLQKNNLETTKIPEQITNSYFYKQSSKEVQKHRNYSVVEDRSSPIYINMNKSFTKHHMTNNESKRKFKRGLSIVSKQTFRESQKLDQGQLKK